MPLHRSDIYAASVRLIGEVKERHGAEHHPFIVWGHELCAMGRNVGDEIPWCSSGLNALCFVLGVPRSGSAAARSWLIVGVSVPIEEAQPGDIVVIKRGPGIGQDGAHNLRAPGHVFVFHNYDNTTQMIHGSGGNQSNAWTRGKFPLRDILDIRRIA